MTGTSEFVVFQMLVVYTSYFYLIFAKTKRKQNKKIFSICESFQSYPDIALIWHKIPKLALHPVIFPKGHCTLKVRSQDSVPVTSGVPWVDFVPGLHERPSPGHCLTSGSLRWWHWTPSRCIWRLNQSVTVTAILGQSDFWQAIQAWEEAFLSAMLYMWLLPVESGNIARPFMLRTLYPVPVWLYLWSSVSIFATPGDPVLVSIENTNLHVPAVISRKAPNISEWSCVLKPCRMRRCYESKLPLFYNSAIFKLIIK